MRGALAKGRASPVQRLSLGPRRQSGRSSGVEHNLAKVGVEGSNPFARSSAARIGAEKLHQRRASSAGGKQSAPVRRHGAAWPRRPFFPDQASIPAHPSNPAARTMRHRPASIPPNAINLVRNPRPIRPARATPSAAAPGCERVGNTGDTNSSVAPARTPATASRRSCAGQVRRPRPSPGPWTPCAPGSSPRALTTTRLRARARRLTSTNRRTRSDLDSE